VLADLEVMINHRDRWAWQSTEVFGLEKAVGRLDHLGEGEGGGGGVPPSFKKALVAVTLERLQAPGHVGGNVVHLRPCRGDGPLLPR